MKYDSECTQIKTQRTSTDFTDFTGENWNGWENIRSHGAIVKHANGNEYWQGRLRSPSENGGLIKRFRFPDFPASKFFRITFDCVNLAGAGASFSLARATQPSTGFVIPTSVGWLTTSRVLEFRDHEQWELEAWFRLDLYSDSEGAILMIDNISIEALP